jgi:hypothetical protein
MDGANSAKNDEVDIRRETPALGNEKSSTAATHDVESSLNPRPLRPLGMGEDVFSCERVCGASFVCLFSGNGEGWYFSISNKGLGVYLVSTPVFADMLPDVVHVQITPLCV